MFQVLIASSGPRQANLVLRDRSLFKCQGGGAAGIQSQHQNFGRPPPLWKDIKIQWPPLDTVSYFAWPPHTPPPPPLQQTDYSNRHVHHVHNCILWNESLYYVPTSMQCLIRVYSGCLGHTYMDAFNSLLWKRRANVGLKSLKNMTKKRGFLTSQKVWIKESFWISLSKRKIMDIFGEHYIIHYCYHIKMERKSQNKES